MNRTQLISILAFLGGSLCYAAPAFAYLDPGTGSIILQGLIASVAGLMVVGRLYWQRLKQFFSNLTSGGKNEISDSGQTEPNAYEVSGNDDAK